MIQAPKHFVRVAGGGHSDLGARAEAAAKRFVAESGASTHLSDLNFRRIDDRRATRLRAFTNKKIPGGRQSSIYSNLVPAGVTT